MSAGCSGCCSALRPRYKRLVDSIFPANSQDGLVRNNMEKLTFYALSSPEKLDRIGEYLAQRVARDISRHRNGYVVIAMEAMDQLLVACHAQSLNLFVESFLKMIHGLLESHEPTMQLLATSSFVKFANIEEDTPSYHRRYDFFVSKFSSLCHNNHNDPETRNKLRVAGLKGLQGVVRKTVSDDLQVNIWDEIHMEKIIPSLLFNMQENHVSSETPDSPQDETTPWTLAENCLRELMSRATFGHIRSVIRPVLKHLDHHELWIKENAIHMFKVIMYSIQAQYSYAVIQLLMSHLDEKSRVDDSGQRKPSVRPRADAKVRRGIVIVLSNIVAIAAGESIGPSVLEIFNSLLNHLRNSIDVKNTTPADHENETLLQEAVINTLGVFANNLPDYQKIEIMMFIMGKVPLSGEESRNTDVLLQHILLKSLLEVGTKYRTVQMAQAFPSAFLQPLLDMSLANDPAVRLVVQQIFHTLLDRHENLPKLQKISVDSPLPQLTVDKCSRQDIMFIKKNGPEIMVHIYENVQLTNNTKENFEALYVTLGLLCIELGSDSEALIELIRLIFAIQDLPNTTSAMTGSHRTSVHALVASFLYVVGHLTAIPSFCTHIEQVIKHRREKAQYLLPWEDNKQSHNSLPEVTDDLLFDKTVVSDALQSSGHDTSRLLAPYMPRNLGEVNINRSISDLNSINVEVDSISSSPGLFRKHPQEEITVESLKKMMAEPLYVKQEEEKQRRLQVVERFRTATFEDLVTKTEQQTVDLQNKLNEILGKLPPAMDLCSRPSSPHPSAHNDDCLRQICPVPPPYPVQFPEFFVF